MQNAYTDLLIVISGLPVRLYYVRICVLVTECTCESLVSVTGQCVAQPPYCRIVLQSFSIPTATLTTSSAGLTVAASDISLHITADWHYKDKDL